MQNGAPRLGRGHGRGELVPPRTRAAVWSPRVLARSAAAPVSRDLADVAAAVHGTAALTVEEAAQLREVKVAVFSAQQYVKDFLQGPVQAVFPRSIFIEAQLDAVTAELAQVEGCAAVIVFVNDICTAEVVEKLAAGGVKLLALRCAGYDRVDLQACQAFGVKVVRVPTYSPQSVAEHALALMLALNRKLPAAYMRVSQGNYSLSGLVGFQMYEKTVGVVGTGGIGTEAVRILKGIGCRVIAHDLRPNPKVQDMSVEYKSLEEMLPLCDIVTLHCPLLPSTANIINKDRIHLMKPGAMLINVSRGGLLESDALFDALESGRIGSLGLDVHDHEGSLFFQDFTIYDAPSRMKAWNRKFSLLLSYPQVLVTPHSAFLTTEALSNIANTTITNIANHALGRELGGNEVKA